MLISHKIRTHYQKLKTEFKEKLNTSNSKSQDKKIRAGICVANGITLTTIFSLIMHDSWEIILDEFAKYILFPAAALASIGEAAFSWRDFIRERAKKGKIPKIALMDMLIDTALAAGVSTAVLGGLILPLAFALASPIVIASAIGFKALYQGGKTGYYLYKLLHTTDPLKKHKYLTKCLHCGLATITGLMTSAGLITGIVFSEGLVGGIIGALGGTIIATMGAYEAYKFHKKHKEERCLKQTDAERIHQLQAPTGITTNNCRLHQRLGNEVIPLPAVHYCERHKPQAYQHPYQQRHSPHMVAPIVAPNEEDLWMHERLRHRI